MKPNPTDETIEADKRKAQAILAACADKPVRRILSTADIPPRVTRWF
jgi:hypothetical protein